MVHIQYLYLAGALVMTLAAATIPVSFLALAFGWTAMSLWLVASAYFLNAGSIFRKGQDGRIPIYMKWLFIPFLMGTSLYNTLARKRDKTPPVQKIDDHLFLARRLVASEMDKIKPCKINAVLDVTAEFSALDRHFSEQGIHYLNIPVLDQKAPSESQLIQAVNWIHAHVRQEKTVMVHCALGRGRSVLVMAAYLISRDPDLSVETALTRINSVRTTARLNRQQMEFLKRLHKDQVLVLTESAWLIANPAAGGGKWEKNKEQILARISPYFKLEVRTTSETEDARHLAVKAMEAGADVVIACGGDGTVSQAAAALVHTRVALGIIPFGTTNALSHVLWGIRAKLDPVASACENIIRGKRTTLDAGLCNDDIFLLVAGIGFEQQMIAYADRQEKDLLGQLAYIKGLLRAVSRNQPCRLTIQADHEPPRDIVTTSLIAANAAPFSTLLAQGRGTPDHRDGLLDITWLNDATARSGPMVSLAELALSATDMGYEGEGIGHFHARKLKVSSQTPLPYVLDGEEFAARELDIRILPASLNVLLPQDEDQETA